MTTKTRKRFSLAQATAPSAGEVVDALPVAVDARPAKAASVPVKPTGVKSAAQRRGKPESSRRLDVQTSDSDRRIAFTWRMRVEEADKLEDLLLNLRRHLGRPRLDRATVLQALVDLAVEKDNVRTWLTKRLDV